MAENTENMKKNNINTKSMQKVYRKTIKEKGKEKPRENRQMESNNNR